MPSSHRSAASHNERAPVIVSQHSAFNTDTPIELQSIDKKPTVLETHGYVLGKTIGQGSYATVKVAASERHGSNVAIKIVSKFSAPSDYLKKFLPREIETVKGLKHPNLIRFLQAIETTHRVYIIMEYAENGSLLEIIRKESYIDEARSRNWFRQLVDGIAYCHERGVVHRDIKCENMLMDNSFNLKVSDFGFARSHLRHKSGSVVLSETFCGSYAYASPEILRGIPYDPTLSDIWSMGVVLFAMVYGRLPFDDTNFSQLVKQVSNKVSFPREPKVSSACRGLICKILSPLKHRTRIIGIKSDQWYCASAGIPAKDTSTETLPFPSTSEKVGAIETPVSLVTKEQLKAKAPKVEGRSKRRSTLEEKPVKIETPTEDSSSSDNIYEDK